MDQENRNEPSMTEERMPGLREVFLYFLLLGFINIGGPVAQIVMAAIAFVSIVVLKVDVAKIAAGAMVCGIVYAGVKALH